MPDFPAELERFRNIVFADPALQHKLRQAPDRASFVSLVLAHANEHGCLLDSAGIEAAINAAARAWMLRWIER
jgi:hypothetical protein